MKVWLIGQDDREEMRPIAGWLSERTPTADLRRSRTLASLGELETSGWRPDLVVVLESHPDEYSVNEVMRLFALVPVSRIVCCAGLWSESAGRTRKNWPLAVRVAAVHALPRLAREWELLSGQPTDFRLPATASREEWFAAQHPAIRDDPSNLELMVRIESPDAGYREMLGDLLTQQRIAVTASTTATVDVILWDVDPWHEHRLAELHQLAEQGPVVALAGWVTPDLQRVLLPAGVQTVVPKLGDQANLLKCLWSVAIAAAEP